jgi:hypothetical protein
MASCNNSIKINSDVNTVNIQPDNNRITVVNPDGCSVNVTQPITNVIQVATPGITGPIGLTGPSGSVGPSGSFDTSSFVTTSSFNNFTSSIQSEVDSLTSVTSSYVLNSQTGSFATTSSFNSFTSSIQSEVNSLTLQTGSYATTGSNNFVGNQVITGSLTVSGSSTFTNIGPAVFSGTSTFTNITSSGNISASGNIIATEITASKLTSGGSNLILGWDSPNNNIYIQKEQDFIIDGSKGSVEIYAIDNSRIILGGGEIQLNTVGDFSGILMNQHSINLYQHVTASGNISSSGTITANAFVGGGSGITGVVSASYALTASYAENAGGGAGFPFEGDAVISGSLLINAFSTTSQSLSVVGSGSTVFDVIGSVGTLFSVDDDLTGTLFTVNDISGFPVLEASASGDVYIGKSPQSLYTTAIVSSTTAATTHSLSSLSTSSYDGAFFEYTAQSGIKCKSRKYNVYMEWK